MSDSQKGQQEVGRALRAREAGIFLAAIMGKDSAFPAATMWRLARLNVVRTVRIRRLVFFRTVDLERYVAAGGLGLGAPRASA